MKEYILLIFSSALVNNVILGRFLGLCPAMGVTTRVDAAVGMGMATTFVMSVAALVGWAINTLLLEPFDLGYLRTITFILIIASTVQFTEMVVRKVSPSLFELLGIYLPLITSNCAVLGVALLLVADKMNFISSILFALGSAMGFTLVLVMFAGLRERLAVMDVPRLFSGPPIAFIVVSILALAFMGFAGMGAN